MKIYDTNTEISTLGGDHTSVILASYAQKTHNTIMEIPTPNYKLAGVTIDNRMSYVTEEENAANTESQNMWCNMVTREKLRNRIGMIDK